MFMERKFGKDGPKMEKYFDELKENKYPTTLLFFPEGTTIDVETRSVSQKYAKESNRQIFNVFMFNYILYRMYYYHDQQDLQRVVMVMPKQE